MSAVVPAVRDDVSCYSVPKAFQRVQGLALRLGGFLKPSSDCSHGLLWSAIKGCRNRKGIVCIFQSHTCSESYLRSFSINISVVMEEAVNPRLHLVQQRHFFPCGITAGKGTFSSFVWGNCSSIWIQWTPVFWERCHCSLGIGVVDYCALNELYHVLFSLLWEIL